MSPSKLSYSWAEKRDSWAFHYHFAFFMDSRFVQCLKLCHLFLSQNLTTLSYKCPYHRKFDFWIQELLGFSQISSESTSKLFNYVKKLYIWLFDRWLKCLNMKKFLKNASTFTKNWIFLILKFFLQSDVRFILNAVSFLLFHFSVNTYDQVVV